MPRALKVCSTPGCPELTPSGRCDGCDTAAERARGTAAQRGYGSFWSRVIRPRYLVGHPFCCICYAPSSVPDHHPVSRRDLVAAKVKDPDAWHRLRPLCTSCHNKATSTHQPGGWHANA